MTRKIALVLTVLFICGLVFILLGKLSISKKDEETMQAMGGFKLGMTMDEVKNLITDEYTVQQAGISYRENPSREEYETTEEFMIELKQKGITLQFNHYRVLIRIENDNVDSKRDEAEER